MEDANLEKEQLAGWVEAESAKILDDLSEIENADSVQLEGKKNTATRLNMTSTEIAEDAQKEAEGAVKKSLDSVRLTEEMPGQ